MIQGANITEFWDRKKKIGSGQPEKEAQADNVDACGDEDLASCFKSEKNQFFQSHYRHIRVFISSTFRDMQAERDILIKKIFPQLRKMCEERAVTWTEVDLRWGITTEQAAEGMVLPLCLEEIHRCRPYFICLLGERYGWVPDSFPDDLLETQPWLKEHLNHSVTELEILYGVFREESMLGHAYFYFRNPRYLETIPTEKHFEFIEENIESANKLLLLKQKIQAARNEKICHLREGYLNPEQLGEWILEDFSALINRLYPRNEVPDPLEQEAARHEAYARSRCVAFIGRKDLLTRLDEQVSNGGPPLILTGDSGCGKSALLAKWGELWHEAHPQDLIIQHYIGSSPDSVNWQGLVRRILSELKRNLAIPDDVPLQPEALRTTLEKWIMKVGVQQRVILILDALNQISDQDAARQLGWLPVTFPSNFSVLVSSLPGECLDTLRRRNWPEMHVPLFSKAEIAPAALSYFRIFSKTPSHHILNLLESTPAACNALYLRAVLDELRQFGKHEELEARAEFYLSSPDPEELFQRIIIRWEQDYGEEIVRNSLCCIWAARRGLAESELVDLLGKEGQSLPRSQWTPFYLATESSFVQRSGLLNFFHDFIRKAVQLTYLRTEEERKKMHIRLAAYFGAQPMYFTKENERINTKSVNIRKLDEYPWQLFMAGNWQKLRATLIDLPLLGIFTAFDRIDEVIGYWKILGTKFSILDSYKKAVEDYEKWDTTFEEFALCLNEVATLFRSFNFTDDAANLLAKALSKLELSEHYLNYGTAVCYGNLAILYMETGRYDKAEPVLLSEILILEQIAAGTLPLARARNNLTSLYLMTRDVEKADLCCKAALEILENRNAPWGVTPKSWHPNSGDFIDFSIQSATLQGDLAEAVFNRGRIFACRSDLEAAITWGERAVQIGRIQSGVPNANRARYLYDLSGWYYRQGEFERCEVVLREASEIFALPEMSGDNVHYSLVFAQLLKIWLKKGMRSEVEVHLPELKKHISAIDSSNEPALLKAVVSLADILAEQNLLAQAEEMYLLAIKVGRRQYPNQTDDLVCIFNNLGRLYLAQQKFDFALQNAQTALELSMQGSNVSARCHQLCNLSILYQNMNNLSQAETFAREAIKTAENAGLGPKEIADAKFLLGIMIEQQKRFNEAHESFRQAYSIFLLLDPQPSPSLDKCVIKMASICGRLGFKEKELGCYKRSIELKTRFLKPNDPEWIITLNNYALILNDLSRDNEALPVHERLLSIRKASLHNNHPDIARSLSFIGLTYFKLGNTLKALPCFRQALEIFRNSLGEEHPKTKELQMTVELIETFTPDKL